MPQFDEDFKKAKIDKENNLSIIEEFVTDFNNNHKNCFLSLYLNSDQSNYNQGVKGSVKLGRTPADASVPDFEAIIFLVDHKGGIKFQAFEYNILGGNYESFKDYSKDDAIKYLKEIIKSEWFLNIVDLYESDTVDRFRITSEIIKFKKETVIQPITIITNPAPQYVPVPYPVYPTWPIQHPDCVPVLPTYPNYPINPWQNPIEPTWIYDVTCNSCLGI